MRNISRERNRVHYMNRWIKISVRAMQSRASSECQFQIFFIIIVHFLWSKKEEKKKLNHIFQWLIEDNFLFESVRARRIKVDVSAHRWKLIGKKIRNRTWGELGDNGKADGDSLIWVGRTLRRRSAVLQNLWTNYSQSSAKASFFCRYFTLSSKSLIW